MDIKLLLDNERAHRSLPFWSWNDELDTNEVCRQIDMMAKTHNGGFFMHARGGLTTPYMGDEWFKAVKASVERSKQVGLDAWAYDENGWPSGFADGKVPAKGLAYQQKRMDAVVLKDDTLPENVLGMFSLTDNGYTVTDRAEKGVLAVVMKINRFYLDTFNPEAVKYFIDVTHEEYYRRLGEEFGKGMKGFFTDEPQYNSVGGDLPWSHVMEDEFKLRYGYSLTENLAALFVDCDNSAAVRYDYWSMVGELFRTAFIKQMSDWCHEHNCMLTGHMMNDTDLGGQAVSVADAMACYEYFDIPGIDWLGRNIGPAAAAKQIGSAAAQLGRPALSESFALCGWDVSPNDLRLIAGWQFVNGVSMICQHLEAYSLRGLRKRDYPAALSWQLPWYEKAYSTFNLYLSKLGAVLSSGEEPAPLLVLQPMMSVISLNNRMRFKDMSAASDMFNRISEALNDAHILHHYGNEIMMRRMGSVDGAHIIIGGCRYDRVLIPQVSVISENTLIMLLEFAENGGEIFGFSLPQYVNGRKDDRIELLRAYCHMITPQELPSLRTYEDPSLTENGMQAKGVHIAERRINGEKLFYIINLTDRERTVTFSTTGEYSLSSLDLLTDTRTGIATSHGNGSTSASLTLAPKEALTVLAENCTVPVISQQVTYLPLQNECSCTDESDNFLTLDFCEYAINGGEWQPAKAVITLFRELLDSRCACHVSMRYRFTVSEMPSRLFLLAETPEKHSFCINGKPFEFKDIGWAVDPAFRKTDIISYIKKGSNELVIDTEFYQRDKVYEVLYGESVHETERNKLTYDTELESIYLMGDFGVSAQDTFTYGERNAIFAGHRFEITSRPATLSLDKITEQGHLFFAGNISLSQKLTVAKEKGIRYHVKLKSLHAACAELFVNGKCAGMFVFTPHDMDVTDYLTDGENELTFRLYSGNRNLLGPHHRPAGELYSVGPSSFTDKHGWTDDRNSEAWTDDYSFVRFGIEL